MPYSTYLPEHMGTMQLTPSGPFVAGSYAELTLTYTAGTFGIDDTGMVKISWRTTSDMSKPQFDKPAAPNFTTVETSNGAKLDVWFDRLNIRPYANTLLIRVGRGYLRAGDTLTVRMGDRRQGSPGYRLQTNCEARVELRTSIDAFATYEFTELPEQPAFALVPGPAAHWKAIWPSLAVAGESFVSPSLPRMRGATRPRRPRRRCRSCRRGRSVDCRKPSRSSTGDGPLLESCRRCARRPRAAAPGRWARAGPRQSAARRCGCAAAALLGRSARAERETIGMGTAENYFRYARDLAFVDIVGHQGNDFQITDAFWAELNRLTAEFDAPGRFVCVPGYEWSGNTGMGGDRNVFFRGEGRSIRRSSHILVEGQTSTRAIYTADELFRALDGEDAVVIAHVGGRYADIKAAHDGRLERSVEVHSTWGTFEWLLHDAFEKGYRIGVVCHSDDHKGRPGATRPGASTFGAIGGLTCYLMPELTRDALFEALRRRRHYGTTGTRMFLDLCGTFDQPVTGFSEDPRLARAENWGCTRRSWATSSAPVRSRCGLPPRSSRPRQSSASTCCMAPRGADGASLRSIRSGSACARRSGKARNTAAADARRCGRGN